MMKLLLLFFCYHIVVSCDSSSVDKSSFNENDDVKIKNNSVEPEYTVIANQIQDLGWGYQILKDGKLLIDQQNIPAIQGLKYFSSRQDAEKTANFILKKIKEGFFPPTLSIEELDSLKIVY